MSRRLLTPLLISAIILVIIKNGLAQDQVCQEIASASGQTIYSAIIVGAGTAGLVAAQRLESLNVTDFVVLEARNRTGGRINTVNEGDHVIDLGAQFLRGTINNPVYDFAHQNQLAVYDAENPFVREEYYTSDGEVVPRFIADQVYRMIEDSAQDIYLNPNFNVSFGQQLKNSFEQRLGSGNDSLTVKKRAVFRHRYNIMSATIGEDLEAENLETEMAYVVDQGNLYGMLRRGYSAVLNKLSENIGEGNVRINSRVDQIYWDLNCQSVPGVKSAVRLANGRLLAARATIVTVPLGVLKARAISFNPDLPPNKLKAIDNLGFGCLNKVFLRWSTPWWSNNIVNTNILWLSNNPANDPIKIDLSVYPNNTANAWYRTCTGFNTVWGQRNILQTWFYGSFARFIEKLPTVEIQSVLVQLLRLRFDTDSFKVPEPSKVIRTYWCSDEFTRGGFTFLDMDSHVVDIATLAAALPDEQNPSLLFAGEATGANGQWATVRAAWNSGLRAGDAVGRLLGKITN